MGWFVDIADRACHLGFSTRHTLCASRAISCSIKSLSRHACISPQVAAVIIVDDDNISARQYDALLINSTNTLSEMKLRRCNHSVSVPHA